MARRLQLPETPLENLGTLLDSISAAEAADDEWAAEARIHFLRNYTTEFVDPYLQYYLMRDDIRPVIEHGGYHTMMQELFDPDSTLRKGAPDVVVLSLLIELLDARCSEPDWQADEGIANLDELVRHILKRTSALVVMNTFLPPIANLLSDGKTEERETEIARMNKRVHELVAAHSNRVFISDFERLYRKFGGSGSLDRRFWVASQAPFRKQFLNEYAKDIAYCARVLKGRARKCLVLDCDNTLWGGVAGEDGLEGIALHDQEAPGVHFREFQRAAISLSDQGVMLALCSKNNEEDVWKVLEEHPFCALKKSHLVAWRINWENKAVNVVSLADELNIGLDSFVIVDDSPQERALINEVLPEVVALAVPDDLEGYSNILAADKLFDTTSRSEEDRRRTRLYQSEVCRKEQRYQFEDLTEYLGSLETVMKISVVDDTNKTRVAQLTQKTNQFNLTTRRYSVADIESFGSNPDAAVCVMSVTDRYGDLGLTGVVIARRDGAEATIDTLLLSCRVLGRKLEFAFVDQCLRLLAKRWGHLTWHADYLPTRKNAQVADFWERAGFELRSENWGEKHYVLESAQCSAHYADIITVEME